MLALTREHQMSAAELARELGIAHAAASYHLRRLAAAGLVELVGQRNTRGGRERLYRRVQRALPTPSAAERLAFMRAVLREAERRIDLADLSLPATTADADIWVTPERWAAAVAEVRAAIAALDADPVPPGREGAVKVSASVLLFAQRADGSA
jgi:predicted ArsR family transcriptional regulator